MERPLRTSAEMEERPKSTWRERLGLWPGVVVGTAAAIGVLWLLRPEAMTIDEATDARRARLHAAVDDFIDGWDVDFNRDGRVDVRLTAGLRWYVPTHFDVYGRSVTWRGRGGATVSTPDGTEHGRWWKISMTIGEERISYKDTDRDGAMDYRSSAVWVWVPHLDREVKTERLEAGQWINVSTFLEGEWK